MGHFDEIANKRQDYYLPAELINADSRRLPAKNVPIPPHTGAA